MGGGVGGRGQRRRRESGGSQIAAPPLLPPPPRSTRPHRVRNNELVRSPPIVSPRSRPPRPCAHTIEEGRAPAPRSLPLLPLGPCPPTGSIRDRRRGGAPPYRIRSRVRSAAPARPPPPPAPHPVWGCVGPPGGGESAWAGKQGGGPLRASPPLSRPPSPRLSAPSSVPGAAFRGSFRERPLPPPHCRPP